ncbi:hypothetical protein KBI23_24820 [bacterium]|nr:hypothetical protein [bacterium]MBP9810362.1 hypothetical protein [bacterium]
MKLRQFTHPWVIALACSLFVQSGALALKAKTTDRTADKTGFSVAGKPSTLSEQALDKEILVLENRFFFHHYGHDPIEKRLERLELLTLGASQFGTTSERLGHLRAAIVQRDKQAAQIMADHKVGQAKAGVKNETNYPVLSTLEWRVLKKTYAAETIDQRLDRLESQLFGVPAQAMSYVDRIERLKKTTGVGAESFAASRFSSSPGLNSRNVSPGTAGPFTALRRGPMPRAGSGSLFGSLTENGSPFAGSPFAGSPFEDFDEGSLTDRLLPEMPDMQNMTDIGKVRGFAGPGGGGFSGQEIQIRIGPDGATSFVRNFGPDGTTGSTNSLGPTDNIFEQLQKPMFEFFKNFGFGPFSGGSSSNSVTPLPSLSPPINDLPNFNKRPAREEIPPYSDPNSI